MKTLKLLTFSALGCIIFVLIAATIMEKLYGTEFIAEKIYGSFGFVALWVLFAILALAYIIHQKLIRKKVVFLIHLSFLIILTGALATTMHGKQGTIHLRQKETVSHFVDKDNRLAQRLPFEMTLDSFQIVYYAGTPAPMDYVSMVTITNQDREIRKGEIAMNKILSYRNFRFYQSGYDDDELGTTLSVSYDPIGVSITYFGYGLLLLSMILFFFDHNTQFRRLLKKNSGKATLLILLFFLYPTNIWAETSKNPKVLPKEVAAQFGDLYVLYNNRICPLQTLAKDFTTKLYGKPTYNGLTAEQVFTGWIFFYSNWKTEPMIKTKKGQISNLLQTENRYVSLADFISNINEYKLEDALYRIKRGESVPGRRSIEEADEKYNIIRFLYSGKMLKIFPIKDKETENISWYAQGDDLPSDIDDDKWLFIKKSQDYLHELVVKKDYEGITNLLLKIKEYQVKEASGILPSDLRFGTEKLYNSLVYTKILAICCIIIGIVSFIYYCLSLTVGRKVSRKVSISLNTLSIAVFLYLTLTISLRWIISGHFPVSNGYETMQFMAWCCLILAFVLRKKLMFLPFGFLMCGLTLMVSMMGESNPQITLLIPVLSSPLLSIHVVVIMLAYSLFAFMMLNGLAAFIIRYSGNPLWKEHVAKLQVISQILLYPALFCLTTGIFVGAVWANVSWGRYWGWDPKEVWALITMLLYSLAIHTGSLPCFRKPMSFHLFSVLAFLSVLITYFGVNFILGGMHSYA